MTHLTDAAPVGASPRTPRPATRRQNLYAATMLAPLAATLLLAGGKIVARRADLGGFVQTAQAQQAPRAPAPTASAANEVTPAQTAAAPYAAAATGAASPAVAVLLEQANYWRNQQQYDQATESLKRALALDPRNADALALTGMIAADRGNRAVAENALSRLRSTAPGDPRIDKIDQALRVGAIPQEALTDARKLAADGRQAEAVDRYNRVFRGNPPPDRLSVEYYQTLAGTEGGWEQARDGLARVVRQNPQDLRAQLAYAQILTYREGARTDGIARLAALAKNPTVAEQANTAWRQALGWLPDNKSAVDPINNYLTVHPNDAQLANKLEAARSPAIRCDRSDGGGPHQRVRGAEQEPSRRRRRDVPEIHRSEPQRRRRDRRARSRAVCGSGTSPRRRPCSAAPSRSIPSIGVAGNPRSPARTAPRPQARAAAAGAAAAPPRRRRR